MPLAQVRSLESNNYRCKDISQSIKHYNGGGSPEDYPSSREDGTNCVVNAARIIDRRDAVKYAFVRFSEEFMSVD